MKGDYFNMGNEENHNGGGLFCYFCLQLALFVLYYGFKIKLPFFVLWSPTLFIGLFIFFVIFCCLILLLIIFIKESSEN